MMAFGTDEEGVQAFIGSRALMGDLGTSYIGAWVGDIVTLGAARQRLRLLPGVRRRRVPAAVRRGARPRARARPLGRTGRNDTPAVAAVVIAVLIALIALVCAVFFGATPFDTFLWSGTIGTLILLVAYVLATIGCIKLVFVDRKLRVPHVGGRDPGRGAGHARLHDLAQRVPYPTEGPARWFPVVAFGWLLVATVIALAFPGLARRLSRSLASADAD